MGFFLTTNTSLQLNCTHSALLNQTSGVMNALADRFLVGAKWHIANDERVLCSTRPWLPQDSWNVSYLPHNAFAEKQCILKLHRQGATVSHICHTSRIADQNHINPRLIHANSLSCHNSTWILPLDRCKQYSLWSSLPCDIWTWLSKLSLSKPSCLQPSTHLSRFNRRICERSWKLHNRRNPTA